MAKELVETEFIWCICYIDKDYLKHLTSDLSTSEDFKSIQIFIPTVTILNKNFKGKAHFTKVPALFNYGFVKIPMKLARSAGYMNKLKMGIGCIYAWVRDPSAVMSEHPILSVGNKETRIERCQYPAAIAYDKEIERFAKSLESLSIYDSKDIESLKPGDVVTLHGSPFDDLEATVLKISRKRKEVLVSLDIFQTVKQIKVSFDNVFYTIYASKFNEGAPREASLEEMQENGGYSHIDALLAKVNYIEEPTYGED